MARTELLRALPSVDALLTHEEGASLLALYGHTALVEVLRSVLGDSRTRLQAGETLPVTPDALLDAVRLRLEKIFQPTLRPVINATGVIIHTNLGRAPLSRAALAAVEAAAAGYSTLEFDLDSGKRGSRLRHAGDLLAQMTGAEAALVVNNNAAALVLLLSALAQSREVIISRGQLIEIGGGFRVPDVMAQSGALLAEVGTTNRTRAEDYERAIHERTALLLHTHASNFKIIGFTEETPLAEMAMIARQHGLYLVDDLGSGTLLDTSPYGLEHEPTVQESLAAGADLVCFSGDKLLGGPQAGIIAGKKILVDTLKRHPLARAIRADKLCLAALTATLEHYRRGEALTKIPVWQMITRPLAHLQATAHAWAAEVGGMVIEGESTIGGGSLPGATLPTALLALDVEQPDRFLAQLRTAPTPVIARIAAGRVLLDPRTVLPGEESTLVQTLNTFTRSL